MDLCGWGSILGPQQCACSKVEVEGLDVDVVLWWKSENLTKETPNNMPHPPFCALEVGMVKASGLKRCLGSGEVFLEICLVGDDTEDMNTDERTRVETKVNNV